MLTFDSEVNACRQHFVVLIVCIVVICTYCIKDVYLRYVCIIRMNSTYNSILVTSLQ